MPKSSRLKIKYDLKDAKPCPTCGSSHIYMENYWMSNKAPIEWVVSCKGCDEHTLYGSTEEEALQHWENGDYSVETILLRAPLPAAGIDDDGAMRLAVTVVKELVEEYKQALIDSQTLSDGVHRRNAARVAQTLEKEIERNPFVQLSGESADVIIRTLRQQAGVLG